MNFGVDDHMKVLVKEVSKLVSSLAGIYLGDRQYHMVESRLNSRMTNLGLQDAQSYRKFFHDNRESETNVLVSLLTTHHSFFFREFAQFEHLRNSLPQLLAHVRKRDSTLRIWSAACSRGQEAFSLAIYLHDYLKRHNADIRIEVFGSDVDGESIEIAKNGVFKKSEVSEVPLHYLSKYFARGTGAISDYVKVNDLIRSMCHFETKNLMHIDAKTNPKYDVVFCRNVFIYFEESLVKQCTHSLLDCLYDHGQLYLGTAESINGNKLNLKSIGTSAYSRAANIPQPVAAKRRVFCIDDSPSIVKILKNILSAEHGFEVVGSAANGVEAMQLLKHVEADIITLDLHMPVMDGFEFLEKYQGKEPVIVVSSVAKTDSGSINRLKNFGIRDYVEKPSLNNLRKHSEEIRAKIITTLEHQQEAVDLQKGLKIFGNPKHLQNDHRQVHFFLDEKNIDRYAATFSKLKSISSSSLPPICVWLSRSIPSPDLIAKIEKWTGRPVGKFNGQAKIGGFYVGEVREDFPIVALSRDEKNQHLALVGKDPGMEMLTVLRKISSLFVVLEEDSEGQGIYRQVEKLAGDIMPRSSFFYFISKWCRPDFEERVG